MLKDEIELSDDWLINDGWCEDEGVSYDIYSSHPARHMRERERGACPAIHGIKSIGFVAVSWIH